MTAKQAVRIFIFGLFLISLLLISLVFYLELSGKLKDRSACIVLPNEGGYVESWAPYLTQLSRALGVSDLSIKTYTTSEELHDFIHKAERLNVLWIEVPLRKEFSLKKDIENNLLSPLFNRENVLESSPLVVQKTFLNLYDSDLDDLYTLPFSMNPLVQVYKQNDINQEKNSFLCSIQNEDDINTFISFSKSLLYPYLNDLEEDDYFAVLPSLVNYLKIETVRINYPLNELMQYFFKNNNKTILLRASDLGNLSVEQRLAISISSLTKNICSDFSYIVFPYRESERNKERIKAAQEHLLIPELAFNITSKRNNLAVNLESISKNVFNDFIKKQVRQAENCLVPGLEEELQNKKAFSNSFKNLVN